MDISYVPMARGFVYLAAVMDWASRRVLAHRISITMQADFCIEALHEALAKYGQPEIFNTDQGSQFTSTAFTEILAARRIAISMDGRGCWRDKRLRRAPVEDHQVRAHLTACLRQRQPSPAMLLRASSRSTMSGVRTASTAARLPTKFTSNKSI